MLTFGIDNKNDLFIDNSGNIAVKSDIESMKDIYVNKVQTNRGEIVYNTLKGIDYFNTVFCSPAYPDVFQNQVINELTNTEETQSITGFKQTIKNGILSYSVNCYTSYGNFKLNG